MPEQIQCEASKTICKFYENWQQNSRQPEIDQVHIYLLMHEHYKKANEKPNAEQMKPCHGKEVLDLWEHF